jgi:iron complex transport system substrate-binding protein
MKVVSFLPAATKMIYDMGLNHLLYGVTFECPPEAADQPKIVRYLLEGKQYSSIEIDRIFSASKAEGKSLYYIDEDLLESIEPDLIITQDTCEVCLIDTACTLASIQHLTKKPKLLTLSPDTLLDVFDCATKIGIALGEAEIAYQYTTDLKNQLAYITETLTINKVPIKRVLMMEWVEPIYNCGHWIPYQIAAAGGIDLISNPGGNSIAIGFEEVVKYNPEIIIIAPCGFSIERTEKEIHLLTTKEGWNDLLAVKNSAIFLADFDMFTQPSIGTLVLGIKALSGMFYPELFPPEQDFKLRYTNLNAMLTNKAF